MVVFRCRLWKNIFVNVFRRKLHVISYDWITVNKTYRLLYVIKINALVQSNGFKVNKRSNTVFIFSLFLFILYGEYLVYLCKRYKIRTYASRMTLCQYELMTKQGVARFKVNNGKKMMKIMIKGEICWRWKCETKFGIIQ